MTTIEAQVMAADEARYQALYALDMAALEGMLARDYLHTHATGKTDDKASFLASIASARYRFVHAERTEQRIRVAHAAVLLSGKTKTTLDMSGETKVIHNAFLTVWVRAGDSLELLHWQATRLPDA